MNWFIERLDWYFYLIRSRWHIFVLGHQVFRHEHCDSKDCTFDKVVCWNCHKSIGWIDKELNHL